MDSLFLVFALLAAFAILSLMSSERQRKINQRIVEQPEPDPSTPSEPPTVA